MTRASSPRIVLGLTVFGGLLAAEPAWAQPATAEVGSAAKALFDDGRKLMAAGKTAEACPKLEASLRLLPGIGTLYNLAECYEKLGRTASAWTLFRDVVAQTTAAHQIERAQAARERVRTLDPILTRMVIHAPDPVKGLNITRDGVEAAKPMWGVAVPVDPGDHVVRATAPDAQQWEETVHAEGRGALIAVTVPTLAPLRPAPLAVLPSPPSESPESVLVPAPPPASEAPASGSAWRAPVGMGGVVLGALGVGTGIALGFVSKAKANAADCDAHDVCSAAGVAQRSSARSLGNAGTWVSIGGGVVAAGGALVWILASPATTNVARPTLGLSPGGITLAGRF